MTFLSQRNKVGSFFFFFHFKVEQNVEFLEGAGVVGDGNISRADCHGKRTSKHLGDQQLPQ